MEKIDPPDATVNVKSLDQPMQDIKEEQHPDTSNLQRINDNSMPNGDSGPGWNDAGDTGRNGHPYDDSIAEPESHGTGIKEDG